MLRTVIFSIQQSPHRTFWIPGHNALGEMAIIEKSEYLFLSLKETDRRVGQRPDKIETLSAKRLIALAGAINPRQRDADHFTNALHQFYPPDGGWFLLVIPNWVAAIEFKAGDRR